MCWRVLSLVFVVLVGVLLGVVMCVCLFVVVCCYVLVLIDV